MRCVFTSMSSLARAAAAGCGMTVPPIPRAQRDRTETDRPPGTHADIGSSCCDAPVAHEDLQLVKRHPGSSEVCRAAATKRVGTQPSAPRANPGRPDPARENQGELVPADAA